MSAQDNNYFAVLLEEIRAQNKAVLEYVGEIPKLAARLESIEQNVVELKQDVKVIKAAVTDVSHQVSNHEQRISRLEAA
jgi:chromosome segregation ATPase